MKRALITGITGQDGSYLAAWLFSQGYEVHGTSRAVPATPPPNFVVLNIPDRVHLHASDLTNSAEVAALVRAIAPGEIYHLAGQSSVGLSFQQPSETMAFSFQSTINLLEAVRKISPGTRFYHSSSSEMFGGDLDRPIRESDPPHPRSPYAVGKAAAHWAVASYRESYGLFASSGILFNHESPLRPERFVTRKVTTTGARIKGGAADVLRLGDLSIRRDWGYAPEYVHSMWLMLQQDAPEDLVIATGEAHSLQEFVEAAFSELDLDWRRYTVVDQELFRPNEVRCSLGDPTRARATLGWKASTRFAELVRILVRHDWSALHHDWLPLSARGGGRSA